jgi:hypothetical protein
MEKTSLPEADPSSWHGNSEDSKHPGRKSWYASKLLIKKSIFFESALNILDLLKVRDILS